MDILKESLEFEEKALEKYREVLSHVDDDIALEELLREMIRLETEHCDEVRKMLDTN
ncbi:hypothetical protein D3C87_2189550 [compost metagenome]